MHLPFWLTTTLLFPILLYQGKQARRTTPRLPEAGVGVETHDQGLASQLARQIHERTGQAIAWHTFGVNGIRLGALLKELDTGELPEADVVVLSMGVNDTTGFTPRFRFRQQLRALRQLLAPRYSGPILLLSVPPMHLFTALPSPLRHVMGWRARQLDNLYIRLARQFPQDFCYVNYPVVTDPALLAPDGYHPGQKGYRYIAEALADRVSSTNRLG